MAGLGAVLFQKISSLSPPVTRKLTSIELSLEERCWARRADQCGRERGCGAVRHDGVLR